MWPGGMPQERKTNQQKLGWNNSAIIMFPVISSQKDDTYLIDGKQYRMGKHGIARHLPSEQFLLEKPNDVFFIQTYVANTEVNTEKGTFSFPVSYEIRQRFSINPDDSEKLNHFVQLSNLSDVQMPFAFGWHPAFLLTGDKQHFNLEVHFNDGLPSLGSRMSLLGVNVVEHSEGNVVSFRNANAVILRGHGYTIELESNIGNMQIWSPKGQELVAIEPVSALSSKEYSGELKDKPGYQVLAPRASAIYTSSIKIRK